MRITLATLIVLYISLHCRNQDNSLPIQSDVSSKSHGDPTLTLHPTDTLWLPLDNSSDEQTYSIQYNETLDLISFVSTYRGELYFYNLHTKNLVKKTKLQSEGPNGMGNLYRTAHLLVNLDSIFYLNPWSHRVYLGDSDGNISRFWPIETSKNAPPDANVGRLMTFYHNHLYLSGIFLEPVPDHTKILNFYDLNLLTGEVMASLGRPAIYNLGDWGGYYNYNLSWCFNATREAFLYSFGIDSEIIEIDLNGKIKKHYLAHQYDQELKPLTDNPMDYRQNKSRDQHFVMTMHNYGVILYDQYNKLYYRFYQIAATEEEYAKYGTTRLRRGGVVIADDEIRKIGDYQFPEQLNTERPIITPYGLLILSIDLFEQNEGFLPFVVYTPISI